ncbi:MAG: putative mariner transposase C9 mutant [Streblomastix strix]|uniref:Putative mariner transposase C9 mutant n=1 Tax=Streblomastix strix TaxID=222440 RepID=A0A5J4VJG3_9EUKA|nr:MAG: putative mariner transposase C9 mutant [Streblomastix strix]
MGVYGNLVPQFDTIKRWQRKWESGFPLMSKFDGTRRPKASGYIERIEKILIENKYISLTGIAEEIKLNRFTVKRIIKEEADFRKIALRWVPYTLTNEIKAKRVDIARIMLEMITKLKSEGFIYSIAGDETWIYYRNLANSAWIRKGDEIPTRVAKGIGSPKVMVTIFFSGERMWLAKALDSGLSMNSDRFIELILNPLFQRIKAEFPSDLEPLLHFNNVTAHTAAITTKFICKNNIIRLPQPPYSHDLSPLDFYLFGYLNGTLKGITFESAEQVLAATEQILQIIDSRTLKGYSITDLLD